MIVKKGPEQIDKMYAAGRLLAKAMTEVRDRVAPAATTKELDSIARRVIEGGGGIPSFLGYHGSSGSQSAFPGAICASVNEVIVHGIPNSRKLLEGDIVSIDVGVILDGWHADSAATFAVGTVDEEIAELLKITKSSLDAAIEVCLPGNRVSDIGVAVEAVVQSSDFSIVREFVGHGIGRSLHEDPQIANFATGGRGALLEEGMVLAIEPMVNAGVWQTKTLEDGWTVVTADGAPSAHFEHTVAITANGPWVLTALDA